MRYLICLIGNSNDGYYCNKLGSVDKQRSLHCSFLFVVASIVCGRIVKYGVIAMNGCIQLIFYVVNLHVCYILHRAV